MNIAYASIAQEESGGLFRIDMRLTSALLPEVKKEAVGEGRRCLYTQN